MKPTLLDPGMPADLPPVSSPQMQTFLHKADDAYYSGMEPLTGDYEYDLLAAAAGHEPFVTAELPSLNNARRDEDLDDWLSTAPETGRLYHLELKIDGVSVLVHYERGEPFAARSRKLDVPVGCLDLPHRADGFTGTARGEAWHPRGRGCAAGRLRARDATAGIRWTAHAGCIAERQQWPEQYRNPVSITTDEPG
ncbi:MAG: hypothetical protein AAFX65_08025 [Cyanobacteria bacterium J06638_7]